MKRTLKHLFRSAVVCFICVMLLTSSTYAWYTDNAPATVDDDTQRIEIHWCETNSSNPDDWTNVRVTAGENRASQTSAMFNYEQWEPGHAQVRYIEVEVENLEYAVTYEITGNSQQLRNTGDPNLAQVIDVYFIKNVSGNVSKADLNQTTYIGTLAQLCVEDDVVIHGSIDDAQPKRYALVLKMRESADNTYQGKSYQFDLKFQAQDVGQQ